MRKLAIAAGAFSAAVFAANYILPESWLVKCALGCILAGAALFVVDKKVVKAATISLLALAVGFLCFSVHARETIVPASELSGEITEITARVLTFPTENDSFASLELRLEEEGLPKLRILLYDYYKCVDDLHPGQTIRLTVKLKRADIRWGESYDYYNSNDIYLVADTKSNGVFVISDDFSLSSIPAYIGKAVTETIDRIFPEDTAPFMKALMAGDRSDYNSDTSLKTAMSYAGFAHIIAVSGMHVAFLVGFITLIFGKSKRSSGICIALVWLFVLATGASPSAVRAGVMQSMLLLAPIVKRENDPITSLSAALALILTINPFAAASVSLQLSFGAMAGILCFGEKIYFWLMKLAGTKKLRRIFAYPAGIAASSVSVLIFTAPLMALYFGYIDILSPLTNILGIWAVSLCFGGGYAACLLSLIIPKLGVLMAWIVSWLARYIFSLVRTVCAIPLSVVFFENKLNSVWLAFMYALMAYIFLCRKNKVKKFILALTASALMLAAALFIPYHNYRNGTGSIAAINVGQGQCLAVMSGENTVLVDCGSTGTQKNAGEKALSYLRSRGRKKIDLLVLTHLHKDHCNGVETLMELVQTDMLIIQQDYDDADGMLDGILESAERNGTKVVYLQEDAAFSCGNIRGELYAPGTAGDINERCITAKLSIESYDMLITADISSAAENELAAKHDFSNTELLIVGHHGSKYASSEKFLDAVSGDTAIISVGYNTYGHPTDEVLERLADSGYNVYRTDVDGTVEIRIG